MLINKKAFGAFISKKREQAGISQGFLAEKMGYGSGQFVSNWERGASLPPLDKLPKLASILNIPIDELINFITLQTKVYLKGELTVRNRKIKSS